MLGAIPLAWLADRVSRVRIVWIATIGWAVATALNGLVVNPFQLFCTRIGVGFGQAYSVPVFASLLTDTYPIQGRARAYSLYWIAQPIGLLLGPFVAGAIAAGVGRRRRLALDVHPARDPAAAPRRSSRWSCSCANRHAGATSRSSCSARSSRRSRGKSSCR